MLFSIYFNQGENPFHIHRHTARRLVCEEPKIVENFNALLRRQMENQFTISQFGKFMGKNKNGSFNTSKEIIKNLDKID